MVMDPVENRMSGNRNIPQMEESPLLRSDSDDEVFHFNQKSHRPSAIRGHSRSTDLLKYCWVQISKKILIFSVAALLVTACLAVAIGFGVGFNSSSNKLSSVQTLQCNPVSDNEHPPLSKATSIKNFESWTGDSTCQYTDSVLGEFDKAAVSSDGTPCAQIAVKVLETTQNAADAAIAGLFCDGVINTQSMGLGGGFLLTYYSRSERKAYTLDSREVAPAAATEDMYGGDSELSTQGAGKWWQNKTLSLTGGLAVGVPGELRGYYELFSKFGSNHPTVWEDIIEPTIALCVEGHLVNWHMARALSYNDVEIYNEPSMSVFINPSTGKVYKEGDILKRPQLAETLRVIQQDPDALYSGELSDKFIEDLKTFNSIITKQDLLNYHPKWRDNMNVTLMDGKVTMYSMPPPGSGHLLGFILNVLDNYKFNPDSLSEDNKVITYQRITEALKYTYAKRTELGDMDFVDIVELLKNLTSEDYAADIFSKITDDKTFQDPKYYGAVTYQPNNHGTAHLSVLGPNGDAVSVTSTINLYFGAKIRSVQTGIVLNDEMDDFSSPNITNSFGIPPSPNNFIRPGKRPLSSMCPVIFIDNASGDVSLIAGAAGGTKISSGTAIVAMNNLWFGMDIKQAIDARRIHHQLFPMELAYEEGFDPEVVEKLHQIGHEVNKFGIGGSVVCGIARGNNGNIYANSDFRKAGEVDGF